MTLKAFGRRAIRAAALAVGMAGLSAPAMADGWHHGRGHGWEGWHGPHWYGPRLGFGFGYYPPPVYYPPRVYYPPAYYYPPYYSPPPVYYAPPAYYPNSFNVTIPIR